ncbi:MAG: [Kiritimatiellae bacterium]|nr:[FeFe] hydrogenase H-cluster radical SAM maturase HydE [Kiritimatiellia bacterium]
MTRQEIRTILTAPSADALFKEAQAVRLQTKGTGVFLRGLIELSSICLRDCLYCGMRHSNANVRRYALTDDEIVACAALAQTLHFGTVVLQAGENERLWTRERVAHLIHRIKVETGQRVTLSLGERSEADTAAWREAGADRYLLRFETTDRALFAHIHPGAPTTGDHPRIAQLRRMKAQGYEIGSGIMLGIPGQTLDSLIEDLLTFQALQLDMVGLGPYLRHPETPLGQGDQDSEVPVSVDFTCRCYAVARLLLPSANIPSTTALSSLDPEAGRIRGLSSGANVFMPNLTPAYYREGYQIYPGKICVVAPQADSLSALHDTLHSLGLHHIEG